jgi:CheY-like chemotaxis protein
MHSTKFRQVLLNLLDNAIKFTESGSVTFRVGNADLMKKEEKSDFKSEIPDPKSNIIFQVEDTGIGIPEEKLEEIFDPFTHLGDGRLVEGTGLGLSISRSLIELMGGRLSVESPANRQSTINNQQSIGGPGSTFTVELALPVAEETIAAVHELERPVIGYKGERKSILIVDDNIENLSMLVSYLEPLGFEIRTAEAGEEAIGKAEAFKPHLVLLDLLMPGIPIWTGTRHCGG